MESLRRLASMSTFRIRRTSQNSFCPMIDDSSPLQHMSLSPPLVALDGRLHNLIVRSHHNAFITTMGNCNCLIYGEDQAMYDIKFHRDKSLPVCKECYHDRIAATDETAFEDPLSEPIIPAFPKLASNLSDWFLRGLTLLQWELFPTELMYVKRRRMVHGHRSVGFCSMEYFGFCFSRQSLPTKCQVN